MINNDGDSINRIYEVKKGDHIDLYKIFRIKQFVDLEGQGNKRRKKFWIEVYMDYGQIVVLNYENEYELEENYTYILNAWKAYTNDTDDYYYDS